MVHFVGAGSGAVDLITVRGAKLAFRGGCGDLRRFAGQSRTPEPLQGGLRKSTDSAKLTLEEVIEIIKDLPRRSAKPPCACTPAIPSIYGAVREQFDELDAPGASPMMYVPE